MQKFMISQRKKSEYMAKIRRRDELIARDAYKWDLAPGDTDEALPSESDNTVGHEEEYDDEEQEEPLTQNELDTEPLRN